MKNLLIILTLMIGLMSCSDKEKTTKPESAETDKDKVEILYFHGKQRCATCRAIEENTVELVNTRFAKELKDGSLVFKNIDISTPEGEEIADRYEVTWSSLFVNSWKDGKETRNNITEFAFANARNNPDNFKKELTDIIRQSLR